ncbi:hypothetical protein BU25DRAFT_324529, partial [Macroventuria anomochaeta]
RYAALSYVWGVCKQYMTLTGNLDAHLQRIMVRSLSRTVRNALECAEKLRLRYLWVDALYIIQNSAGDKSVEL